MIELTPEQQKEKNTKRAKAFIDDYKKLVEKHKLDWHCVHTFDRIHGVTAIKQLLDVTDSLKLKENKV